ncbi:glycosyltransferase [Runella sp. CRIBMP]|uniref:glycosyltransferase n=1 Tax=Runella sp. CRIBMP TaxID=2683261 RepID=UPI001411D5A4|nr:glycosyltransferase [Runella sp. CRIBMP]NBB22835.1 glycosyltransferase [Runella sp. CRIBMP]
MNVLHYSLGLPPYRSGGLTKYATDLLEAQANNGINVSLLYPGDFTFWKSQKMRIIGNESFKSIHIYELQNSPVVPLLHGVKQPIDIYTYAPLDESKLLSFYETVKPNIFHVHTIMGLPIEVLDFFKSKKVKLVFSTHDYYGLCPKVNFINQNNQLCSASSPSLCAICNIHSSNTLFLKLRNSKYLLKYKNKFSGKVKVAKVFKTSDNSDRNVADKEVQEYEKLLNYYKTIFLKFDFFHFNSEQTKEIFQKYLPIDKFKVIPISHSLIKDNRKEISFTHNNTGKYHLCFIGSTNFYKGFPWLKSVLVELYNEGHLNWTLEVWGGRVGIDEDCKLIHYKGKYSEAELSAVFQDTELLIVPSIWKETFSFITLEALSFGIPVLVSENVGAKDLVYSYHTDFVVPIDDNSLKKTLKRILLEKDPLSLKVFNQKIVNNNFNNYLENHLIDINNIYCSLLSKK